jgi:hypothetical protein
MAYVPGRVALFGKEECLSIRASPHTVLVKTASAFYYTTWEDVDKLTQR